MHSAYVLFGIQLSELKRILQILIDEQDDRFAIVKLYFSSNIAILVLDRPCSADLIKDIFCPIKLSPDIQTTLLHWRMSNNSVLFWTVDGNTPVKEIRFIEDCQPLVLGKRKMQNESSVDSTESFKDQSDGIVQKMWDDGFILHEVDRDGNCFFKVLGDLIGLSHQEVRKEVVTALLLEYDKRIGLFEYEDYRKDVDRRDIVNLLEDKVWQSNAMDFVPLMASKHFRLKIIIHYADGGERVLKLCKLVKKIIHVLFDRDHYSILKCRENFEPKKTDSNSVFFYRIVGERKKFGVPEKRIHWCGFPDKDDIWIPENELIANEVLVEESRE